MTNLLATALRRGSRRALSGVSVAVALASSTAAFGQVLSPVRGPHGGNPQAFAGQRSAVPANAMTLPGAGAPPASAPGQPSTVSAKPQAGGPSAQALTTPVASTQAQGQPVSLLQQPPKQAEIQSQPNQLTIKADNASLTQTLQRIADQTGMKLEGISGDQRVFGDFGPGAPREVLNSLLAGAGYNIVMIGALDNGAPRQLILSQKKDTPSGTTPAPQQQPANSFDDDPPVDTPPPDDPPQQLGPPNRGGEPGVGRGARTPQQMLEQMQQQRQQADQPTQQQ